MTSSRRPGWNPAYGQLRSHYIHAPGTYTGSMSLCGKWVDSFGTAQPSTKNQCRQCMRLVRSKRLDEKLGMPGYNPEPPELASEEPETTGEQEAAGDQDQDIMEIIADITGPETAPSVDMVNHPPHYNQHPKQIECIDVIEDNPYPNLANAMRYLWRVSWGGKWDSQEDLNKAVWYVQREISRREKQGVQ